MYKIPAIYEQRTDPKILVTSALLLHGCKKYLSTKVLCSSVAKPTTRYSDLTCRSFALLPLGLVGKK